MLSGPGGYRKTELAPQEDSAVHWKLPDVGRSPQDKRKGQGLVPIISTYLTILEPSMHAVGVSGLRCREWPTSDLHCLQGASVIRTK